MTPVTVRCSTLGRLAAFLLIVLIASPFTAPFSAMSGDLETSPCGPADSLKSEATQADAIAELGFVYIAPSWSVVACPPLAPAPLVEFTHINRVLRL